MFFKFFLSSRGDPVQHRSEPTRSPTMLGPWCPSESSMPSQTCGPAATISILCCRQDSGLCCSAPSKPGLHWLDESGGNGARFPFTPPPAPALWSGSGGGGGGGGWEARLVWFWGKRLRSRPMAWLMEGSRKEVNGPVLRVHHYGFWLLPPLTLEDFCAAGGQRARVPLEFPQRRRPWPVHLTPLSSCLRGRRMAGVLATEVKNSFPGSESALTREGTAGSKGLTAAESCLQNRVHGACGSCPRPQCFGLRDKVL